MSEQKYRDFSRFCELQSSSSNADEEGSVVNSQGGVLGMEESGIKEGTYGSFLDTEFMTDNEIVSRNANRRKYDSVL